MKVKEILVSQPKPSTEKSPYYDIEARYGVHIHFHQFIRIESLTPREFRAQHINILDYSAIVFNSRHSVDHFFNLCAQMRVAVPETMHYFCISEQIANYLQKYIQFRKRKVFFSPNNKIEELVPQMLRRNTDKFLMILSDVYNDSVIKMFADNKLSVTPAVMYRTVHNDLSADEKRINYDMFVLFTPAGVQSFQQNFPDFQQEERVFVAFGSSTAKAMKEAGLRVDIEDNKSITAAIDAFLKENHKRTR